MKVYVNCGHRSFSIKASEGSYDNSTDAREFLSKEVIGKISDGCYQNIIRRIIFDSDTSINWSKVQEIINDEMPEIPITSNDSNRFAKKSYVSKCVAESPLVPEEDVDDYPEKWTTFREDMRDYKTWCFVDAVEDGIFDESEWDLFNEYWEGIETSLAQPYA